MRIIGQAFGPNVLLKDARRPCWSEGEEHQAISASGDTKCQSFQRHKYYCEANEIAQALSAYRNSNNNSYLIFHENLNRMSGKELSQLDLGPGEWPNLTLTYQRLPDHDIGDRFRVVDPGGAQPVDKWAPLFILSRKVFYKFINRALPALAEVFDNAGYDGSQIRRVQDRYQTNIEGESATSIPRPLRDIFNRRENIEYADSRLADLMDMVINWDTVNEYRSTPTYVVRGLEVMLERWRPRYLWLAKRMATSYWAMSPKLQTTSTSYFGLDDFWFQYAEAEFEHYREGMAILVKQAEKVEKAARANPSPSLLRRVNVTHALALKTSPPRPR